MRTLILAALLAAALPARAQRVTYFDNLAAATADGRVLVFVIGLAPPEARHDSLPAAAEVWRRTAPDGTFERLARLTRTASWAAFQAAAGSDLVRALEAQTGRAGDALWGLIRANPDPSAYGPLYSDPRLALALGVAYDDRSAASLPPGTALEYSIRYFNRAGAPFTQAGDPEPIAIGARVRTGPPTYPIMHVAQARALPEDSLLVLRWNVSLAEGGLGPTNLPLAGRVYRQQGTGPFEPVGQLAEATLNVGQDSLALTLFDKPTPGLVYRYVVRPVNRALFEGPASDTAHVLSAWFGRVPLLDSVRVESDSLGARLRWMPLDGVYYTGVKIWRSLAPDGPFTVLDTASIASGSYLDRTAPPARLVYYRVAGLTPKTDGNIPQITVSGSWENNVTPPPAPEGLSVRPAGRDVEVSWTLPADTSDVAGYRVYRSFGNPDRWQVVSRLLPPSTVAFTDTSGILSGAAVYFYTVESMSRSGLDGFRASPVSIRPPRPVRIPAPLGVSASAFAGAVTLLWPSVADREPLVQGYLVYRSTGDGPSARVSADTVRTLTWTDTTTVIGQSYRYRITAVAITGDESAPSPPATVALPIPYMRPEDVRAWRTDDGVALTWTGMMAPAFTGYRVLRRRLDGPETFEAVADLPADATSWSDPQPPAEPVVYVVAARFSDGKEVRSDEQTVTARETP